MKPKLKVAVCALAALACAGLAAAPRFSPETSSLFVDFVDPDGGVPGRPARPGPAHLVLRRARRVCE